MNLLRYILAVLAAFSLLSCGEDVMHGLIPDVIDSGDTFTTAVSLNVAEMNVPSSRALSDKPDYGNLKLYVLEFRYNPASTLVDCEMIQKYQVEDEHVATDVDTDGDIHFNITLNKTHEPRVLHFIAVPKETELNIPYGLEGVVIPPIAVGNMTPAYWQRVTFPDGYAHYTTEKLEGDEQNSKLELNDDTKTKLTHIPMLCNFAKITVTDEIDNDDFELTGFVVCNQPMHGYIAPWDAEASAFPDFLDKGNLKSFSVINRDYKGRMHEVDNPIVPNNLNDFNLESKYLYERTVTSLNNPFIIIRGIKNGETRYYKLDIGYKNDDTASEEFNMFEYYDVLRNFEYKISLNKVEAEGYASAQEAFDGVVYNNFSFDLTTKTMLNVSNGEAMLWVDKTTIVVTSADETTQSLSFRFDPNINEEDGYDNQTDIALIGYTTGDAIKTKVSDVDQNGWRTLTFTTFPPSLERKMQEFIVYNKTNGLGRVITVIVRNPWEFKNCMVWGGTYNTYDQFWAKTPEGTYWNEGWEGKVPNTTFTSLSQQTMTVTFRIEDNIPEAMFPLDFVFEAGNQNITQNTIGDLLVQSAKSLFNDENTRIQYVKTITWADYNAYLAWNNQHGTIVITDKGEEVRVIRGRFSTTATIADGVESTIRVANPYMHLAGSEYDYFDVTFKGVNGVAPIFPITDTLVPANADEVTHPN